jgi:hypothetical protein
MKKTSLWPDNYQVPAWLPNWKNPAEYAHLTKQTSYSFKYQSSDSCDVVAISADMTLSIRRADRDALIASEHETPKVDFAWEFLRRNPEYQTYYQHLIEKAEQDGVIEQYQSGTGLSITKQIDESRLPSSPSFHAALYRTLTKWGLAAWLPDPSQDLHDAPPLHALSRMGVDCWESDTFFMDQGEPIPYDGGIILTDTEESFIFDITRPLAPQLQHAKEVFETAQKSINGGRIIKSAGLKETGNKNSNITEKLYVTYLRVLDASASKETIDKDIIEQFYKEGPLKHPYGYGFSKTSHTNLSINTLHNWKKAAVALRDNGYKYLL